MIEHYLALCFYLQGLQPEISMSCSIKHAMKLSYSSQLSFTVSGGMVIKIQHVIHQIKCWGLVLDRINDPHVYGGQMTQMVIAHCFLHLHDPGWDTGSTEGACHSHWERRMHREALPKGHWESRARTEQCHRFLLSSAVLCIRSSPGSDCTKPVFSAVKPFLGPSLWLRIWSLLCEKASAYMEDRVDLQWACW